MKLLLKRAVLVSGK